MNEELKKCPFCGGNAKLIFRFGIDICCECTECEARTKMFFVRDTVPDAMDEFEDAKAKATGMWNRRVNDGKTD